MSYTPRPEDLDELEISDEVRRLADAILPGNREQLATHHFVFVGGPADGRRVVTGGARAWLVPYWKPLEPKYWTLAPGAIDDAPRFPVAVYELAGESFANAHYRYARDEQR